MFDIPPLSPDTAANRSGQLTDLQRKRLRNNMAGLGCGTLLLFSIPAPLLVAVAAGLLSASASEFDPGALIAAAFMGAIGLGLLGLALWLGARLVLTWQDFSEARIEQGDGQVAWRGSSYRAEASGRQLSLQDVSLAPGPYRFYYLPRSGRVLSTEKLSLGAGGSADDELRAALAQANKFPLEALGDMRSGRIGDRRGGILSRVWISTGAVVLVTGGFLTLFAWAVAADSGNGSWVILLPVFIVGLVILGFVWSAVTITRDVMDDQVLSARGVVRREVRRSNKSTSYYYVLEKLRFNVGPAPYNALIEGRAYSVYYLPRSKRLVGIEPAV